MALPVHTGVVSVAVADPDNVLGRLPEQAFPVPQDTDVAGHAMCRVHDAALGPCQTSLVQV